MEVSFELGDRFSGTKKTWVVIGDDQLCAGGHTVDEPVEVLRLSEVLAREGVLRRSTRPPSIGSPHRGLFTGRSAAYVPGVYVYPAVMHPFLRERFDHAACLVVHVARHCVRLRARDGSEFGVPRHVLGEVLVRTRPFDAVARQAPIVPGMVVRGDYGDAVVVQVCGCRYRHCVVQVCATGTFAGHFASELTAIGEETLLPLGDGTLVWIMTPLGRTCTPLSCFDFLNPLNAV